MFGKVLQSFQFSLQKKNKKSKRVISPVSVHTRLSLSPSLRREQNRTKARSLSLSLSLSFSGLSHALFGVLVPIRPTILHLYRGETITFLWYVSVCAAMHTTPQEQKSSNERSETEKTRRGTMQRNELSVFVCIIS